MDSLRSIFELTPAQVASMLAAIPLLPLLGAIVNGFFGRRLGHERAGLIATATVLGSFVASLWVFAALQQSDALVRQVYTWFDAGGMTVELGLAADHLSGLLLLVITGVGTLIHWYSTSYMEHDEHSWRYFAYLNLFVASMLLLVLGDSLVTLFVGWEGVGLCSYLLIGFWFTDEQKAAAGKKAFIVNRIGDFGFLIGMFTLFALFGTLKVDELKQQATQVEQKTGVLDGADRKGWDAPVAKGVFSYNPISNPDSMPVSYRYVLGFALLCLFIGATGKSAQIPLYVWLPDAMAGPTPVSALIHAATMVTAGVYMIARLSFLYVQVPWVLAVVAVVGALTALFAALMAFGQNDIKKVLAYSTVSQLGFMFVGVGAAAFSSGTFHLMTHAFFKACLFLGSGAVIHGLHEEQDIRNMGGLKKYMPQTRMTFLLATIAIAGVLPFSGFWSKDEILHEAWSSATLASVWAPLGPIVYVLGTITALCTSFYMFRVYFLTFEGDYRGDRHPHESPPAMTIPLWILAVLSVVAGFINTPLWHGLANWLSPAIAKPVITSDHHGALWPFFVVAIVVAWLGFLAARSMYGKGLTAPDADPLFVKAPAFANASANKFWVDEFYQFAIVRPLWAAARTLHRVMDAGLIDGLFVMGSARLAAFVARITSPFQNGDLSRYAALTAIAAAGLLLWAVAA